MTAVEQTMEYRRDYIGGSDLAAILGISPFKTPLDIFLEKTGQAEPEEESEAQKWGKALENEIAISWAAKHGVKIRRKNQRIVHPDYPWLSGHIDRDVVGKPEGLEVKVSSADGWGSPDSADVPEHLVPQPHVYMAITGAERWHVTALLWSFGPPKQQDYTIPRDEEMIGLLIEAGARFKRDHLDTGVAPDPTTSEQANKLWRQSQVGRTEEITPDVLKAVADFEMVKAERVISKARKKTLELILKSHLKNAESSVDEAGKPLFSWKSQSAKRFLQSKLEEDEPELFANYMGSTSYKVLRITTRGKKAAAMVTEELAE